MPNVYLIVRLNATLPFESPTPPVSRRFDPMKPSVRAVDITTTGLSSDYVKQNPKSLFPDPHHIIDPSTCNTYTIAFEVLKPGPVKFDISLSTMSRTKAHHTLQQVHKFVTESDEERLKHYTDGVQLKSKAITKPEGQTCVKVRVGERSVLWYELLTVECEETHEQDGADGAGGRKRVKMPVRGGKGKMQEEHEYADVGMVMEG
jgi:hypothetical protein